MSKYWIYLRVSLLLPVHGHPLRLERGGSPTLLVGRRYHRLLWTILRRGRGSYPRRYHSRTASSVEVAGCGQPLHVGVRRSPGDRPGVAVGFRGHTPHIHRRCHFRM